MFNNLINNLRAHVFFNDEELMYFLSMFQFKTYRKNERILVSGDICRVVNYLNKGLVRYYYVLDGKDHTLKVFLEDDWFADYESFLARVPARICIDALEDVEVFTLSYDAVQTCYNKAKVFERFGRIMAENLFLDVVQQAYIQHTLSAEEQYKDMLNNQPELARRVPLKFLASIFGIEPASLSRIRRRISSARN